ncbi:MAG: VWA domain-containing protein [Planctomycetaceae bacterium]|jgi:hypothetical protein|nr:VWA domain-containing protein [Planctomycetaceae bacterium]MBT6483590.1 VWA domain-containing protein [Planctomycetaceae bacterium]MBT6493090.1 VWA domain-containing protein [Planctomycetaceae bacterium]
MAVRKELPTVLVSLAIHLIAIFALWLIPYAVAAVDEALVIETVMEDDERDYDEVMQELDDQKEIAEAVNFIAGSVSTNVGGSEAPLSQQTKVEINDVIAEPDIAVRPVMDSLPGVDSLTTELGEAAVTGEVGAVVAGYGAALDRLTAELLRMMRSQKLTVVWLFDESESMKDDQQELKERIFRVYEELKVVETDPAAAGPGRRKRKLQDILETSITSFGGRWSIHTPKPTADPRVVMSAIDRIPIDRTGRENMCEAIKQAVNKYRGVTRSKRKLVIVVVSDESGDDGGKVEEVIEQCKIVKAPVYILGRESVFGSLYAFKRWIHPDTGYTHYLPIHRGPETPFAEQLQYDGYGKRRDSHMSGFGPYEQVRIARDTGGIFFQLPHEEADLNDLDNRKNDMLNLREYLPNLDSRRAYAESRNRSKFRQAIWDVIVQLNPYEANRAAVLQVPGGWFDRNPAKYRQPAIDRWKKVMTIFTILVKAQQRLDQVRTLRDNEASLRWRANYDLIYAQLIAYQVRLLQYSIAIDQYAQSVPTRKFKDPKSNQWAVAYGQPKLLLPTTKQAEQIAKFLGVDFTAETLKDSHRKCLQRLARIEEMHPGSPWSRRSEWERKRQFGVRFAERFWVPPPPRPPGTPAPPPPSPPPKL